MDIHHLRRDALLLAMAGLAVLIITPFFFRGSDSNDLSGSVMDISVNDINMQARTLEHGQSVDIPAKTPQLISCPKSNDQAFVWENALNIAPPTEVKIYEYTENFTYEKQGQWSGLRYGPGIATLTMFSPGRMYYVYGESAIRFQCSHQP